MTLEDTLRTETVRSVYVFVESTDTAALCSADGCENGHTAIRWLDTRGEVRIRLCRVHDYAWHLAGQEAST